MDRGLETTHGQANDREECGVESGGKVSRTVAVNTLFQNPQQLENREPFSVRARGPPEAQNTIGVQRALAAPTKCGRRTRPRRQGCARKSFVIARPTSGMFARILSFRLPAYCKVVEARLPRTLQDYDPEVEGRKVFCRTKHLSPIWVLFH